MSSLRVDGLVFAHRERPPLWRDVSLLVRTGESVALVGANGCGKTTLLRLIAGLARPAAGSILIDDVPPPRLADHVGLILQNPDHQMIAESVESELALGLELRGIETAEIQRRVEQSLEEFALSDLRRRRPQQLSGGQKQRVALAAIMIARPAFLLLDEPDSFLDAPSRRQFRAALERVRPQTGLIWAMPRVRSDLRIDRWHLLDDLALCRLDPETLARRLSASTPASAHA